LEDKFSIGELETFKKLHRKSRKAREELRDLEKLNNLIEYYKRKHYGIKL